MPVELKLKIDDPYRSMQQPDGRMMFRAGSGAGQVHTFSEELASIPGRHTLESLYRASVGYSSVRKASNKTFFLRLDVESDIRTDCARPKGTRENSL